MPRALAALVILLFLHAAPTRPPVLGVAHVRLLANDIAKARTFYGPLLGFPEIPQSNGMIAIFRVNDRQRIIVRRTTRDVDDRRQLATAHHIALLVPSIQDALEAVRVRTSADDPNHGATPRIGFNRKWQLNVYDPDGTRIEFMEPWTAR